MCGGGAGTPTDQLLGSIEDPRLSIEAVADTGAEVSVLGKMFYDQLEQKPPIKRHVTLLQAGHGARLKGFVAGPFDFVWASAHLRLTCMLLLSRTRCYWGWTS